MPETATVQITMPEMGESVTEGIVLEWHVAEGDFVDEGDTVVEVSTDKVDAEVPAPSAGVITKLLVEVDDEVPVGAALAEIEATGEVDADAASLTGKRRRPRGAEPRGGRHARRSTEDATAGSGWRADHRHARDGRVGHRGHRSRVARRRRRLGRGGRPVVEVSTDKVDAEVPAPAAGVITKLWSSRRRRGERRRRTGGDGITGAQALRRGSRRVHARGAELPQAGRTRGTAAAARQRRAATSAPRRSPAGSRPPTASTSARSRAPAPAAR